MSWSIDTHTASFTCVGLHAGSYAGCSTTLTKDPARFGLDVMDALELRASTFMNERTGRREPGTFTL